jgi:hypothetical protein
MNKIDPERSKNLAIQEIIGACDTLITTKESNKPTTQPLNRTSQKTNIPY